MYITEIFESNSTTSLKEKINFFFSELDSDYQYVDIKYASGDGGYMSVVIIMRYIPKRKILTEKVHV